MGIIAPTACIDRFGITDTFAEDMALPEFMPSGTVRLTFFTLECEQPVIVAKIVRPIVTLSPHGYVMTLRNKLLM